MIDTFSRYEEKYIVTKEIKDQIINLSKAYLTADPYSLYGPYKIFSHYFDSNDYHNIKTSLSKPIYKEKLRMRSYIYPLSNDDVIFLEIKKKFRGMVNKRRLYLSYEDYLGYINEHRIPEFKDYYDIQILKIIDHMITTFGLKPSVLISYEREAFYQKENDIRITFDSNIKYHADLEHQLLVQDYYIMEIKTSKNFPLWLSKILTSLSLYGNSFSKYGTAYKNIISKENIINEIYD